MPGPSHQIHASTVSYSSRLSRSTPDTEADRRHPATRGGCAPAADSPAGQVSKYLFATRRRHGPGDVRPFARSDYRREQAADERGVRPAIAESSAATLKNVRVHLRERALTKPNKVPR